MAPLRNIRHEHFVREYIKNGGIGARAYRVVERKFPWKEGGVQNPEGYRVIASIIRRRPDVRQREQELRDRMAKKADITMDKILSDYQEALIMARTMSKPADMISAATAQAKLVGLLRDRVETGEVGDFDGLTPSEILEKVAADIGPEAASALFKAWGLDNAEAEPEQKKGDADLLDQAPPSDAVN